MSETGFLYFAYGSNMSTPRLRARTPSARPLATATLHGHVLRFHKRGRDGSAKCDAFATGIDSDRVVGVLYAIDLAERHRLDEAEGLNRGYRDATVSVLDAQGGSNQALIYLATPDFIDDSLHPFTWYKAFVASGAKEHGLPPGYGAEHIDPVEAVPDPDESRAAREGAILADAGSGTARQGVPVGSASDPVA